MDSGVSIGLDLEVRIGQAHHLVMLEGRFYSLCWECLKGISCIPMGITSDPCDKCGVGIQLELL